MSTPQTLTKSANHIYHGHRSYSFYVTDDAELQEIRARQRTFEGAAYRTAMGNLSYAVIVLKLFDRRFYRRVLFTVLSIVLFIMAYIRSQHSNHDFADDHRPVVVTGSNRRIFGRAFTTAGWSVVVVSATVAALEAVLLGLVLTV